MGNTGMTAAAATAAEVRSASAAAMCCELGTAGMVAATHRATATLRVKVGSTAGTNFAKA
jgi:hypothetical protein